MGSQAALYASVGATSWWVWGIHLAAMLVYWIFEGWLRRRAARFSPAHTVSLLPSALFPGHYFGHADDDGQVCTFRVNALTGEIDGQAYVDILDADWAGALQNVPEYRVMRSLSPGFHVVEVETGDVATTRLVCRDLRTRNFDTNFGRLRVLLDGERAEVESFDV